MLSMKLSTFIDYSVTILMLSTVRIDLLFFDLYKMKEIITIDSVL